MRTTTTLLLAIVLLASCNQYQKTPSGLSYKITKGAGKEMLKNGQYVKFNIEYKITPKDSLLNSSFDHLPAYLIIDTSRPSKHSFLEIITKCAVGDKVEFVLSVDTLMKMGAIPPNNPSFHARDMIRGRVEILKTFANRELASADMQNEQSLEKQKEIKLLQDFTAKKGIKTQSTKSGALVEITNPGEAQKADSGKAVSVMYRGTFLDGKEFDSNMGKTGPNSQPLIVEIASNPPGVIQGLDEGLRMFGKGGKGKVYIPAMLGYGPDGRSPIIPPYTSMIFEVEILDVTTPAPKPVAPAMPGQPQPKK